MANPEHLEILKQGVEHWNRWRDHHPETIADLAEADLEKVDLSGANLGEANIIGVILRSRAELYGANLVRAGLRGASLWRANLRKANLSGATLRGANLREARLDGANLGKANLSEADLTQADLSYGDLTETNLRGANLTEAHLRLTKLERANLSNSMLGAANLVGGELSEADFTGVRVGLSNFAEVDLSTAIGLETIEHLAPSTLSIDSVYKSRGKIPEVFLRGCGVPDDMIGYIRSIAGAIQYYSCFISYSTKDQAFADRLFADLQAKGVRCWFAPHDIMGGRKIHEQIAEAIRVHDKLLLILSEHSMASDWVGTEIANAREREAREKKQMLFPITIAPFEEVKQWKKFDADRGKDSAREIREYYIPDFSNWDRDNGAYQKEFEKLVTALKAGASSQ